MLRAQLRTLELLNVDIWYIDNLLLGRDWQRERDRQLRAANITLFLISADFINSHEQYDEEVPLAMARHNKGETRVIPVILRPVLWQDASFGKLTPLPDGGKPVTDLSWHTPDHAFLNIVLGIKRALTTSPNHPTPINHAASVQLDHLIQNFKALRGQISSFISLQGPKDFTLDRCRTQYNTFYGDTMLFLATYLPQTISDTPDGFVETVYRNTQERLRRLPRKSLFDAITVSVTRSLIPWLADLERLGMQMDSCITILELYKQRHFTLM